jgi:hypothetical protein
MPSIHKIDLEHINEEKKEIVRVRYTKILDLELCKV